MKTKAVRIYGKNDLRLEEFELPPIKNNEILAHVMCDSICMSSYKATRQGADHKRIPDDVHLIPLLSDTSSAVKSWKPAADGLENFSPA